MQLIVEFQWTMKELIVKRFGSHYEIMAIGSICFGSSLSALLCFLL